MAQATTEAKPTNCPNCGMRLPEQPLSLCAYCAMPLGMATDEKGKETKNTARIQKVEAHDGFAPALEADPPESAEWLLGWRTSYRGRVWTFLGVVLLVANFLLGWGAQDPLALGAYVWLIAGMWQMVKGRALQKNELSMPVLKRAALITDRRSDTSISGWGGSTRYYFKIEFADGNEAEFEMSGRGVNEGPYTTNLPGVAYTRGPKLLSFKHIRV